MSVLLKLNLAILVFLAVSSGVTKIILMPQDVEFFGLYGFTNPVLIAYGAIQLVGGILLFIAKTRFIAAVIVAITFLISAVVLIMAGKFLVAFFTFVAMLMLGVVMKQSLRKENLESDSSDVIA